MRLSDYKALTFDCYGTLIDWETGISTALSNLTSRLPQPLARDQVLEAHARHETGQQAQTPTMLYRNLLPIVYKRLAEECGVAESPFHDHQPANRHRIANCWIHRRFHQEGYGATMNPGEVPAYDFKFNSMADLVKAHQGCLRREDAAIA